MLADSSNGEQRAANREQTAANRPQRWLAQQGPWQVLSWHERVAGLEEHGNLLGAIALSLQCWQGKAVAVVGLPRNQNDARAILDGQIQGLLEVLTSEPTSAACCSLFALCSLVLLCVFAVRSSLPSALCSLFTTLCCSLLSARCSLRFTARCSLLAALCTIQTTDDGVLD